MDQKVQEQIVEFEKQRQLLMNMGMQKQQMQMSVAGIDRALEELDKTKEEKVYIAVGNILIQKEKKLVEKDLKEQKETTQLRLKTVEKQEESTLMKLNKLKMDIETAADSAKSTAMEKKAAPKA
jgi:prefoldin beta subunit